jgi:hypothetical protein
LHRDTKTRFFVVWEPVLDTDVRPPREQDMRRVADRRATQYWDPKTQVSAAFKRTLARAPVNVTGKQSLVEGEIVWDVIATFPTGVEWGDELPAPAFLGGPVMTVQDAAVQALQARPSTLRQ